MFLQNLFMFTQLKNGDRQFCDTSNVCILMMGAASKIVQDNTDTPENPSVWIGARKVNFTCCDQADEQYKSLKGTGSHYLIQTQIKQEAQGPFKRRSHDNTM